jgi:phosphoribosylanthranilate isomerase
MSLWIKICANTSLADAQLAVDAGADAVGFVFASSPRRVTAEQVAGIAPNLPVGIEKIGVFVDADFDSIAATIERCTLTGVQLHSEQAAELSSQLRSRFGQDLRILRVLHYGEDATRQLEAARSDAAMDAVLIDSRTATAVGGTGIRFDWEAARTSVFDSGSGLRLVAAGGLTPANVAEAIATLAPWGVDVVSGVEVSPGRKSAEKIRAFVEHARSAARLP